MVSYSPIPYSQDHRKCIWRSPGREIAIVPMSGAERARRELRTHLIQELTLQKGKLRPKERKRVAW